ncbi:hypothetical protein FPHOBKDP_00142 [Listeria phage LPJP1]|nr:hypothetical protein FPHOBKDP_00142 [Listeria phage LPJP1]
MLKINIKDNPELKKNITSKNKKLFYDFNTNNQSFLELAIELKRLGIRNNKLHLVLYDKSLSGVDPYDPNLTDNVKARIVKESIINFWYFIREVVRIPVPGSSVHFAIHRGNLAMCFCLLNNLNTVLMLPRQHYKTYSAVGFYLWIELLVGRNYQMIFSHKSLTDSIANLKRLTALFELLPTYMTEPILNSKNDKNAETILTIDSINNTIRTIGPSTDIASADKSG